MSQFRVTAHRVNGERLQMVIKPDLKRPGNIFIQFFGAKTAVSIHPDNAVKLTNGIADILEELGDANCE